MREGNFFDSEPIFMVYRENESGLNHIVAYPKRRVTSSKWVLDAFIDVSC